MINPNATWQELNNPSIFSRRFAFLDTDEHLADSVLSRHDVHIRFGDVLAAPVAPYRVQFCWVRKRDIEKFRTAMEELPRKMMLFGYGDYPDACRRTWQHLYDLMSGGRSSDLNDLALVLCIHKPSRSGKLAV